MRIYNIEEQRQVVKSYLIKCLSSNNISLLLGAGFSMPFLKVLDDFEERLTRAIDNGDIRQKIILEKEFFNNSILPILYQEKLDANKKYRDYFLNSIKNILDKRHSSVLHKMFNIFTTNYDVLIEQSLECNRIEYSDGFSGRLNPLYSTTNFGRVIKKTSALAHKSTEIVTANLLKLHGSLNWTQTDVGITYENCLKKIERVKECLENDDEFMQVYEKEFLIINPNKEKFNTTVLNANYYDQLRIFGNELEQRNSLLLVYGFSFNDEHIRTIVERALLNPTLTVVIFAFRKWDEDSYKEKFNRYHNVVVLRNNSECNIEKVSQFFKEIDNDIE
ncbi:MAG: SIR2 family protein [Clostridiales bacterium]|nr:SIR2 family protein [Clostridiales bacterium]